MDRKKELSKKLAINYLKNTIKNMLSFTLLEIYEENSVETIYYNEQIEKFFSLCNTSQLNEKREPIGKDDVYYFKWILSEVCGINDNDEWVIYERGCWAKIKSLDRLSCIVDLWNKQKYQVMFGQDRSGYSVGFLAINNTLGLIIDVGVYSNDEYYYSLTTMKI